MIYLPASGVRLGVEVGVEDPGLGRSISMYIADLTLFKPPMIGTSTTHDSKIDSMSWNVSGPLIPDRGNLELVLTDNSPLPHGRVSLLF